MNKYYSFVFKTAQWSVLTDYFLSFFDFNRSIDQGLCCLPCIYSLLFLMFLIASIPRHCEIFRWVLIFTYSVWTLWASNIEVKISFFCRFPIICLNWERTFIDSILAMPDRTVITVAHQSTTRLLVVSRFNNRLHQAKLN